MKGITPVVAVTLLIAVTVAASGTVYTILMDTQQEVEENSPKVDFNTDILDVETCWNDNNNVSLIVRNQDPINTINASSFSVYYQYQKVDIQSDPGLVGPQETFKIRINQDPTVNPGGGDVPIVEIVNEDSELTYSCRDIDTT